MVRVKIRPAIAIDVPSEPLLWQLVSAGFAQRRKTIFNNLRNVQSGFLRSSLERVGGIGRLLEEARINPKSRAEALTLDEWARLARALGPTLE